MTEHTYWDELAAGFALHGLSAEEQILFIDHLESCDECLASVNDHEMVAAQLGSIAHYREDDEYVPSWESLRSSIVGNDDHDVVDLAARRRRKYDLSRRSLSAAAALVIVAGGGVTAWQLTSGGSSCSASKGCHAIELDAAGGKSAATLKVQGQTVIMDTAAMPTAPSGKEYVLWQLPSDTRPLPIKEFTAGGGASSVTTSLQTSYADTSGFAVSVEPAGTAPTTPSNLLASGTTT